MAKYIDLESLVNWLKHIPLKDLSDGQGMCRAIMEDDFKAAISSLPESTFVDMVPAVRCKDCVNMGKRLPLPKGYKEGCGCCMVHGWNVSPEDFCSWGETADEKDRREAAEQDAYEQLCNLGNPEDGSL